MKKTIKNLLVGILRAEAKLALKRHRPKIIAVTGSVGKTSTKDAVAAAISEGNSVRKSEKSFNSEIGIPLTILGLSNPWNNPFKWMSAILRGLASALSANYPEILVLEVGADQPKDISSLSSWIKTNIIVFTQFADVPVHISNFSSRESMLEEKLSLLDTLEKEGTVVMNADDDEFVRAIEEKLSKRNESLHIVTYGLMPPANIVGSNASFLTDKKGGIGGFTFKIENEGNILPLEISGVVGDQHIYPSLAGFAVAKTFGINPVDILDGLNKTIRQPGRMRILDGIKDSIIIDDSYNSSPVATERALDTLERIPVRGKRIAVLGDMLELGSHTEKAHKEAGARAAKFCDLLVAVGQFAPHMAEGALIAGMSESKILQFETSPKAGKYLEQLIGEGDVILVKGSQGKLRMEKAVLEIMARPEKKAELLVRQEKEWQQR